MWSKQNHNTVSSKQKQNNKNKEVRKEREKQQQQKHWTKNMRSKQSKGGVNFNACHHKNYQRLSSVFTCTDLKIQISDIYLHYIRLTSP